MASSSTFHNRDFLHQAYWDRRFEEEDAFEWCGAYENFRHLLRPEIRPGDRVLILGCGNSALGACLREDGVEHVSNLDYSPVVIEKMRQRDAHKQEWIVGDMLALPLDDASFDVVVEKGSLDTLMVDAGDPWNVAEAAKTSIETALREASRVLRPSGRFLSITFAQPHFRRRHLQLLPELAWSTTWTEFGDSFAFFFYKCDRSTGYVAPEPHTVPSFWSRSAQHETSNSSDSQHGVQEETEETVEEAQRALLAIGDI